MENTSITQNGAALSGEEATPTTATGSREKCPIRGEPPSRTRGSLGRARLPRPNPSRLPATRTNGSRHSASCHVRRGDLAAQLPGVDRYWSIGDGRVWGELLTS